MKFKDDDLEKIEDETSYKLTDKAIKLTEVPEHYQIKGLSPPSMEVIDVVVKHNTSDVKEACYLFMILKYLFRFGKKDGLNDLYKAKDFLDRLIEVESMKKITRNELNEILEEHKKWLNGNGGKQANLSNADLYNADLSNADLRYANLRYANLYKVNLSNAKLSWCNTENVEGQRILSVQVDTSRRNNKISYWEDLGIWTTGCFQGTLEELKESIERTHKDNEFLYDRYQRAIEYILKEVEVEE